MNTRQVRIQSVDPAAIQENKLLALSLDQPEVERTARFIRKYGLLMPPVVGLLEDGGSRLLSGEREFMALRQLGVRKTEAVMVTVATKEEMDRLSLLLSTLRQAANPLSEGLLLERIIKAGGYTQAQLGQMLGKSVSWVNKRLTLATRLVLPVRELVSQGLLCAHSAQSIAKLPEQVQASFARCAIEQALPKSAVEQLVAAYNRPETSPALQETILTRPRHALALIQSSKAVKEKEQEQTRRPSSRSLYNNLTLLLSCLREAEKDLVILDLAGNSQLLRLLQMSKSRCHLFVRLVDSLLVFAPGQKEGGVG